MYQSFLVLSSFNQFLYFVRNILSWIVVLSQFFLNPKRKPKAKKHLIFVLVRRLLVLLLDQTGHTEGVQVKEKKLEHTFSELAS